MGPRGVIRRLQRKLRGVSPASRLCFAAVLAVVALLLEERQAEACSCMDQPPEVELDGAEAVFVATVGSIQRSQRRKIVQMTVTRAFKGVTTGASITIHTGAGGGDCGISFTTGSSWLVYASRSVDRLYDDPGYAGLHTIPCSRTTPIEHATADIEALVAATSGKTKAPVKTASPDTANVAAATTSKEPATIVSTPRTPTDAPSASIAAPPSAATPTAPANAAPPPGSRGSACDAGPDASFGSFQAGLVALALLIPLARRRSRSAGGFVYGGAGPMRSRGGGASCIGRR
jgi:MYXO-CTERM domain-containing protein